AREGRERALVRQEDVERQPANGALEERSGPDGDDLRACSLDELAEFDARRARRLAGAAIEAGVHVVVESRGVGAETTFPDVLHEPDPPAGRVHLDAEAGEGRAGR